MATGTAETQLQGKDAQPARPARQPRKARTGHGDGTESLRFFLAKPGSPDGVPHFDRECATEPEAIVESLKTGLSYFVVSEWKGLADFSGRKPELRRQAVARPRKAG